MRRSRDARWREFAFALARVARRQVRPPAPAPPREIERRIDRARAYLRACHLKPPLARSAAPAAAEQRATDTQTDAQTNGRTDRQTDREGANVNVNVNADAAAPKRRARVAPQTIRVCVRARTSDTRSGRLGGARFR